MNAYKVLIVEDESIVALDIRHRLSRLGYEIVDVAVSGEDAVAAAERLCPDIVLMDIMLEGDMDGTEAAGIIAERFDLPVVYITAYTDDETLRRVKRTQPFGYLIKPFKDREVYAAIEMACYKHKTERCRREDRKWLEITLDSLDEGIVSADADGLVNYMNGAAERMLGAGFDSLERMPLSTVLPLSVDGDGEVDLACGVLSSKEPLRSKIFMLDAGGVSVPVELSASPVTGEQGECQGVVVAFRNISGRMENVRQLRSTVGKLRQTVEATVQALVVTSEKRDPYTAGHQHRVSKLAVAIARRMDFDEDSLESIRVAGLLHDLGKIYIPAEILSKPARLTDMEFGLMKSHPEVGYEILRGVPFPWPIAEYVCQHHERLDGAGYPHGLEGDDILPEARILAVADVVEAMSSHRPYRAALGLEAALDEVRKGRGTLYDPAVVDACLVLFERGDFSFED